MVAKIISDEKIGFNGNLGSTTSYDKSDEAQMTQLKGSNLINLLPPLPQKY